MSHHSKANSCHSNGQDQSASEQQAPTLASIHFFTLCSKYRFIRSDHHLLAGLKDRLYGGNCRLTQQTNGETKQNQVTPAASSDVKP
jgi:hypothetical protein